MHSLEILKNLLVLMLLAVLVERALAALFESYFYIKRLERFRIKELTTLLISLFICFEWRIDIITAIVASEKPVSNAGMVISATIMAGLTKISNKLFQDILGVRSVASKVHEMESINQLLTHRSQPSASKKNARVNEVEKEDKEEKKESWGLEIFKAVLAVATIVIAAVLLKWLGINSSN